MAVDRIERVDSLLKRVIAEAMFSVMQGDTVAPGLITVTDVHCGKDLRDATVKVSVFGDDALKETALQMLGLPVPPEMTTPSLLAGKEPWSKTALNV